MQNEHVNYFYLGYHFTLHKNLKSSIGTFYLYFWMNYNQVYVNLVWGNRLAFGQYMCTI
jgi:hypothetical protein